MATHNASYTQSIFRGRFDDGSESAASWIAAEGTDWSQAPDTVFRLRLKVQQTISNANANLVKQFKVKFSHNGGAFTDVGAQGTSAQPVRYADSANLTDDEATTEQLTSTFTYVAGKVIEVAPSGAVTFTEAVRTDSEYEAVLEIVGANVSTDDTLVFRLYESDDTAMATYTSVPTVTVAASGTTVTPGVIATTTAAPAASVAAGGTVTPATASTVTTLPAASVSAGAAVTPAAAATTVALPTPTIDTGGGGTTINENWNCTDSSTSISCQLTWTRVAGALALVSNRVETPNLGDDWQFDRAEADLTIDEHYAEAEVTWDSGSPRWGGTCVRFSPSAETFYFGGVFGTSSAIGYRIMKVVAGGQTTLAEADNEGGVVGLTKTIRVTATDNGADVDLELFVNGVSKLTATDTTSPITGNVRTGIGGQDRAGAGRLVWWDNFEASDLGGGGTNVTPAAIVTTTAAPAPVVAAASNVTPGSVNTSVTLDAATAQAGAVVTPASSDLVAALGAVSVSAGANVTPDVVARLFTVPQATASGGGTGVVNPDAIALSFAVPSVTVAGGSVVGPALIDLAFTIPQAVVGGGTVASPDTIVTAAAVPQATVTSEGLVLPDAIAQAVALAQAQPSIPGEQSPSVIAATATIPAVSVTGGSLVTPDVIAQAFALPGVTVSGPVNVAPGVMSFVVTIPQVVIGAPPFSPIVVTVTYGRLVAATEFGRVIAKGSYE